MASYSIKTFVDEENAFVLFCICINLKKKNLSYFLNPDQKDPNLVWTSIESIFDHNSSKKITIYTHNLNFTGILLFIGLSTSKKWKYSIFMRDLNLYSLIIDQGDSCKKIEFRCTYKILPLSINDLAEHFSPPRPQVFPNKFSSKENLSYVGKAPSRDYFDSEEEFITFNLSQKSDTFNFRKQALSHCGAEGNIILDFLKSLRNILKNLKVNIQTAYSTPSLSLKIFLKNFNNYSITIKTPNIYDKMARHSYFGGRCEVYGNPYEDEFIYHFDFSGMYAKCMMQTFPHGTPKIIRGPISVGEPGFYYIKGTSNNWIPTLPHHSKRGRKLMFCRGIVEGWYWYEEILEGLLNDLVINEVRDALIFEGLDPVFSNFIEFFDEIKKRGGGYKIFSKLIINSLYGRLGMDCSNTFTHIAHRDELYKYLNKTSVLSYKEINDFVLIKNEIDYRLKLFKKEVGILKVKSNVVLASIITSKARIKLRRAQRSVILNGGRLLYSDTDSIFASYKKNVDNQAHGEVFWDISKKETKLRKALFLRPKVYALVLECGREVIKNADKGQDNLNFKDFKNIFDERKENSLNPPGNKRQIHDIEGNFDKRKFSKDFYTTLPYDYDGWNYE